MLKEPVCGPPYTELNRRTLAYWISVLYLISRAVSSSIKSRPRTCITNVGYKCCNFWQWIEKSFITTWENLSSSCFTIIYNWYRKNALIMWYRFNWMNGPPVWSIYYITPHSIKLPPRPRTLFCPHPPCVHHSSCCFCCTWYWESTAQLS